VANVFIVAPESLASLFEGTPSIRKDALRLCLHRTFNDISRIIHGFVRTSGLTLRFDLHFRFIQLRDDYKTAKIASMLNNITAE
jgi:exocyst complex component 5